ncbi:hypothetical protein AAKU55_003625 [Oxalobacteraceae bacterium GrIS 1.11]
MDETIARLARCMRRLLPRFGEPARSIVGAQQARLEETAGGMLARAMSRGIIPDCLSVTDMDMEEKISCKNYIFPCM